MQKYTKFHNSCSKYLALLVLFSVLCLHPRGETDWIFVLNIMVPGTPYLNFVCYFLADRVRCVVPLFASFLIPFLIYQYRERKICRY